MRLREWLLVVVILAPGCARVDLESLPPIPDVETRDFVPGAQAQLDSAFNSIRADPGNIELNGRIGMMLQTYKQFHASETMYQRARLLAPKNDKWAYLHGVVLDALGEQEGAVAAFRHVVRLSGFLYAKIRLAELLADEGKGDEAEGLYSQLVKSEEPASEAWFNYGQFLVEQGRPDEGIPALKAAMKISGDFNAAHYQLGIAHRDMGDSKLATEHFRLAEVHKKRVAASSDPILAELLPLNQSPQPFIRQAKVMAETGQIVKAAQFIAMALERDPSNAAAHTSSIGLAVRTGNLDAVDEHFEMAIETDPTNAKTYFNLGLARAAQNRWSEAKEAFEMSLKLDDHDPNTYLQLAILAKRASEPSSRIEQPLRALLALDPEHQQAHWLLAELMTDDSRYVEAEEHLSCAVAKEHPMRPMMFVALARLHARQGDWQSAFVALDDAMDEAQLLKDSEMVQNITSVTSAMRAIEEKSAK